MTRKLIDADRQAVDLVLDRFTTMDRDDSVITVGGAPPEVHVELAAPSEGENIVADFHATGLTLGRHPLELLRHKLTERRFRPTAEISQTADRATGRVAGIVTCRRQRSRHATEMAGGVRRVCSTTQ